LPRNLLRRSPHVQNIFKLLRSPARLPDHFIRNINSHHLPKSFRTLTHYPRQQPRRPPRPAPQIKHPLSGTQIHHPNRLLRDIEMMALHLLAFTLLRPPVELVLKLLLWSRTHKPQSNRFDPEPPNHLRTDNRGLRTDSTHRVVPDESAPNSPAYNDPFCPCQQP